MRGSSRVGLRLRPQDRVDRADEADQLVDGAIALARVDAAILALPLELVEERVLRLLLQWKGTRP
jgi:hypothetical protein